MPKASAEHKKPREITGRTVLIVLIVFFGVIFTTNAILLHKATSTFTGLDTKNPYQAGLTYESEIKSARAQNSRGWKVDATLKRQSPDDVLIEAVIRENNGQTPQRLVATARLAHPADTRHDRDVVMTEEGAGLFRGHADAAPGQWDLIIDLSRDGERLFRSRSRVTLK